ncbi:MAG: radical SAM protein [Candidatus Lokiarchaeota archaeon]|nr:radical SAM protein [Candidatus Lokiarchaeota archaeon]
MLTAIHFLLTYMCNFECDHCFLYCGPNSKGTFTLEQIRTVLEEAVKIGTIEWIYFEGGEPFLFYPIMVEGVKLAHEKGFKIGIVTNSYWATCSEDAELWLNALTNLGVKDFTVSNDEFHFENKDNNLSKIAKNAAEKLNLPTSSISINEPQVEMRFDTEYEKGKPVIGGGVTFRGRAVDKIIEGLPRRKWVELKECPYEDLKGLGRIHVDPFGNAHICQGLSIGNFWETPLSELVKNYDPENHPICDPLYRGGPVQLVNDYGIAHEDAYVDECHMCYKARLSLIDKYPQYLTPKQVYGLDK